LAQSGQDLVISAMDGENDTMTVKDWFGHQSSISQIVADDGMKLDSWNVK
jgi:hypothetical protein